MSKESKYWFKTKRYGWGWGLPQKPQGWIVYATFFAVWLGALYWISSANPVDNPTTEEYVVLGGVIAVDILGLLYFSLKYGEPPKWRWGSKKHAAKPKSD